MSASFAYITAADREEALRIARALVAERLAACVNVLDGMTSVYRWEGSVQEDAECVLIVKTRTEHVDRLATRVRELHSYTCPCVVSWRLDAGNPAFLEWIASEATGVPGDGRDIGEQSA